ncbi:glycosyltransferase family 2 protein [Rhizobium giardinii]|jgi:succinoglycan biosynthesis protein ExoW|uniref:Succinoglycan biosynthesis protein ExoW n=1 Tax=Rhizobium giardinii TaxID=56731 RepID=A0A7W8U6Z3_9HYPH|nr:glycosyltransferase family 2 protein [Rhizobium giardinii]MBB5533980.1 succinoglycan biosynthesis protein ExoW [Rhizobium giardinii]
MAKFTVIIPYYQKQAGILQRALESVFAQSYQDFDIIIVDDQSPFPIEMDLDKLPHEQRLRIKVIKQPNAGPGGARNTGLDNVPAQTDFVAFLDSDDVWTKDHLKNAYDAMTRFGSDCYWASITGGDAFYYHFGVAELQKTEPVVRLSESPLVLEVPEFPKVMLRDWSFLHLSCMVIGRKLFEALRFEAELRLAAEDVLFFCDCAIAAERVILCNDPGAVRGEGVNIFHSIDNDSPEFLSQQFNTWVALDTLEGRFAHKTEEAASIHTYKHTARKQALWSQARLVKRRRMPQFNLLARWVWRDPRILQSVLQLAVGKLSR